MKTNTPSPGLVEHVAAMSVAAEDKAAMVECDCPEKAQRLAEQLVNRAIVAYTAIYEGEELGTVRRSATGDIAQRVDVDGLHQWQVMYAKGGFGFDKRPSLPDWEDITPKRVDEGD